MNPIESWLMVPYSRLYNMTSKNNFFVSQISRQNGFHQKLVKNLQIRHISSSTSSYNTLCYVYFFKTYNVRRLTLLKNRPGCITRSTSEQKNGLTSPLPFKNDVIVIIKIFLSLKNVDRNNNHNDISTFLEI